MKKTDKKTAKNTKQPDKKEPMSEKNKIILKAAVLFFILAAVVGALITGSVYLVKAVCYENSNYILRNVNVASNGYWHNRNNIVGKYAGLNIRKDNIFRIDLNKIKEKVMKIDNVQHCDVRRILPDTIQINIIERVPRARISRQPDYLLDETGTVLSRKYSMLPTHSLPLLTGLHLKEKLKLNNTVPELYNVMQIIVRTLRYYSDIEIVAADVSNKDFIKLYVRYAKGRLRQAIMPNTLQGVDIRMKALRTALIQSHAAQDSIKIYNLSFDGRVVCQ